MPRASGRIKELRNSRGLSQMELALDADVSLRTVQLVESGNSTSDRTLYALAAALNVDYHDIVDSEADAFSDWPWGLHRFFQERCGPAPLAYCSSLGDAESAIKSMRDQWQTHLATTDSHRANSVFGRADQLLNHEYDAYEARYLEIWKKNPQTFLYAIAQKQRVGFSIVLPVTDKAFDRLSAGEISFMDITADDVLERSQNLVLDSAVELVAGQRKRWYQLTDALSFSVFYSIANLSIAPSDETFRLLGFGASPVNLGRLEAIGFVQNGITMPKYSYKVCVFNADGCDLEDTFNKRATFKHYVGLWQSSSLRFKRKLIMRVLRTYQGLIRRTQGKDGQHTQAA